MNKSKKTDQSGVQWWPLVVFYAACEGNKHRMHYCTFSTPTTHMGVPQPRK